MRPAKFDFKMELNTGRIGINNLDRVVEIAFQSNDPAHDRKRYQRILMHQEEFDRFVGMVKTIKAWE